MRSSHRTGGRSRPRGDPLALMYVLAALLMAAAAALVTLLMFVPSGFFDRQRTEHAWVPGTLPGWSGERAEEGPRAGLYETAPGEYLAMIDAYNWEFEPDEVRVPVGAVVTFRGRSVQDYHGIAISGTPIVISFDRAGGAEATHVFDEPGEYPWICSEYCGAGHLGMTGRVVVE